MEVFATTLAPQFAMYEQVSVGLWPVHPEWREGRVVSREWRKLNASAEEKWWYVVKISGLLVNFSEDSLRSLKPPKYTREQILAKFVRV